MGAKAKPDLSVVTLGGSLMHEREPDFSGYATKAGLKCSDGRTIMADAFKHQDKADGSAGLAARSQRSGERPRSHDAREPRRRRLRLRVLQRDRAGARTPRRWCSTRTSSTSRSTPTSCVEKATNVLHGIIREVSLVLAGANPGALIDNVAVAAQRWRSRHARRRGHHLHRMPSSSTRTEARAKTDDEARRGRRARPFRKSTTPCPKTSRTWSHYMVGAALESAEDRRREHSDTVHRRTRRRKEPG